MNNGPDFLDQLRHDARELRYVADESVYTRLAARVSSRVADEQPDLFELLASWFRPVAALLAASILVAATAVLVSEHQVADDLGTVAEMTSQGGELFDGLY